MKKKLIFTANLMAVNQIQNKEELGVFEFLFNENEQPIRKREIVRRYWIIFGDT